MGFDSEPPHFWWTTWRSMRKWGDASWFCNQRWHPFANNCIFFNMYMIVSIYLCVYISLSLSWIIVNRTLYIYIYILNIFDFNVHPLHSCMLDLYLKSHEVGDDISQAVKRFCHFCFSEEVRWWDAEANGKGRFSNETNEVVAWMFVPLSKSLIVSHL